MLPRFKSDDEDGLKWEDLGEGAATILGLARICSRSFSQLQPVEVELPIEAKAILFAAKDRGVIEIVGKKNAFDSVDRFVSVHVETEPHQFLSFKRKEDPKQTLQFVEGFRQLCIGGYVMHHLFREFSLTPTGFDCAEKISETEIKEKLEFASELGYEF